MNEERFRQPMDEASLQRAEKHIRLVGMISLISFIVAAALAWQVLPTFIEFPTAPAERLVYAIKNSVPVMLCLLVAIGMVSTLRRKSAKDVGGSAAGPPSSRLAIPKAFLENTLEQAVLATGAYLAVAAVHGGNWLSLLPVSVAFFVLGRVLFYRGYAQGVEGRALGMTLTMLPTILLYLLVMLRLVIDWF